MIYKEGDIAAIQYLRGIAAMMVVGAHSSDQINFGPHVIVSAIGTSGVDIFFVISGFVMTYTTETRRYSQLGFIWRRAVRIIPTYWLATILAAVLAVAYPAAFKHTIFTWWEFLTSIFFIPFVNPGPTGGIEPLLKLGWTLNYEVLFYGLFAIFLRRPSLWRVLDIGIVFGVLLLAAKMDLQPTAIRFYGNDMVFEFLFGSVVGFVYLNRKIEVPAGIAALALVASATLLAVGSTLQGDRAVLRGGAAMALVASALALQEVVTWRSKRLHALGDATYSIYCFHLFAVFGLLYVWRHVGSISSPWQAGIFFATCLVVSALIGLFGYRWIERPINDRLKGLVR